MKISIIFLNYNRSEEINYSVKKTLLQNYSNFEIIVVDNNSDDDSINKLKENFSSKIILFESKENLGVAGGRNKGAELSSGEVLVFIDDDAHFNDVECLSNIYNLFNKNKDIGVVGFKVLDVKGEVRDWVYNKNTINHNEKTFLTNQYVGCGHAIKAELFKKLKGYSKKLFFWGEEIEFCMKVFKYTDKKIIYYPHVSITHRVSSNSRLYWGEKRMYYKVRNRFLINNMYLSDLYYLHLINLSFGFVYLLISIKYGSFKYFIKGVFDSFSSKYKLDATDLKPIQKGSHNYFKIFINQLKGKVNDDVKI